MSAQVARSRLGAWSAMLLTTVAAIALAASTWQRLAYGVDFTDEAFYAALAYEFSIGNTPFVDEYAIQQTASILSTPLVRLHGASEGLILFIRRAWLLLTLMTAAVVALALAPLRGWNAAVAAALIPIAYIPFAIPSLSYNTLGTLLLTTGLFAVMASLSRTGAPSAWSAAAVLALAACSFAYPTMLPAALTACAALAIAHARSSDNRRRVLASMFATGSLCTLVVAAFSLHIGADAFERALSFQRAFGVQAGGLQKLRDLYDAIPISTPYHSRLLLAMAALVPIVVILPRFASDISAAVLVLSFAFYLPKDVRTTSFVVVYAAILLSIPALLRRADTNRLTAVATVWVPSIIAAVATAWTSSNGLPNAAIGILPVLTLVVGFLARGPALLTAVIFAVALHWGSWQFVYRDDSIRQLTAVIPSGPYAGMRTSAVKLEFLREIERDVASVATGHDSIVFYDNFPAGYLLSALKPLSPTVWIPAASDYPQFDRGFYSAFYREARPGVIVELKSMPVSSTTERRYGDHASDPFRHFFWAVDGKCIAIERDEYTIYSDCPATLVADVEAETFHGVDRASPYQISAQRQWGAYQSNYSGGGAAITMTSGAAMTLPLPGPPDTYLLDATFYSYGKGANTIRTVLGGVEREIRFGCDEGLHRVSNLTFENSNGDGVTFTSGGIGQPALIIDRVIIRRSTGGTPALAGTCVAVSEPQFAAQVVEAEDFAGVTHEPDYAEGASSGWASYSQPQYSGGRAALTMRPGATARKTVGLRPGRYSVAVKGYSYDAAQENEIDLTFGGHTRRLKLRGSGLFDIAVEFPDVTSGEVALRAVSIRQPALIIDALEIRPHFTSGLARGGRGPSTGNRRGRTTD